MKLSRREKVAYGVGAIGKDMVYAFVSGFLFYYFNTVLGISATFIGIVFMGARIFDAFNDPFMGIVVEKTNSRFGKFRPWILIGSILNAVVLYFLFSMPTSLSGNPKLIYAAVVYLLWGITYTMMDIPYWSMIPAITDSGKDRESMSVIARSCAGVGFALPTALTLTLVTQLGADNKREGFRYLAIIIAVIFVIALTITASNVKERNRFQGETPTIKDMFRALVNNDQALIVVVSVVLFNASLYLTQQLALYFFQFDIGNEELYSVFGTVGGAAQILAMMCLPIIRKKFEMKLIFTGAIVTAICGYIFLFLLGTLNVTNLILLCLAALIIFIGFGLATVSTTIFLADSVDYGEWKSNQRNESVIFSLQTFVVKLSSAISVLLAGIGLDVIKLDVTAETQTEGTLLGLRLLMTILPLIGLSLAVYIFRKKYRLTESFLKTITKENKERFIMHREMRRMDKVLSEKEIDEILYHASYGVLSTIGEDGIPYGVPISFVHEGNRIYFHSAVEGHKLDNIQFNNKVSFCIVTDVETIPDQFNTKYMSVILFGTVSEVSEEGKTKVFNLFLEKFSHEFMESGKDYIKKAGKNARIFQIDIEHIKGKGKKG
ncbi:glycoside-pentoside-hexuronide (GPH):cation symporter [Anaeromicropila populeti]|uniref:Melibiose permease n=1 Tax=Anaeromicropila populeti TaxID=37658 RepID=A0A1I6INC0_9FIRM|nr:glycoside-pentoside-hexuronide (GPH):cation symporter [Anaeromicropila populeti]SFR68212.1 melibiose permease [Anaeromicropila populeti]